MSSLRPNRALPVSSLSSVNNRLYARTEQQGECLVWTGCRGKQGYGQFWIKDTPFSTHRVAWMLAHGPIPHGVCVLHHCDNPPCIRVDHLFLGTLLDNVKDMVQKNRQAKGERSSFRIHPECVPRGENHPSAKLTEQQVLDIRRAHKNGQKRGFVKQYGLTRRAIRLLIQRKTWAHVPEEEGR